MKKQRYRSFLHAMLGAPHRALTKCACHRPEDYRKHRQVDLRPTTKWLDNERKRRLALRAAGANV